jgi:predicted ferric reductase
MNTFQTPTPANAGLPSPRGQKPVREDEQLPGFAATLAGLLAGLVAFVAVGLFFAQGGTFATLAAALLATNSMWNLSRAAAFVAFLLLWLSMLFGIAITNRLTRLWPGGPAAGAVHEQTSLLGLGFTLVHVLALLGDTYIGFNLVQLFVPFASSYAPVALGLGQLGLVLMALVTASSYLRKQIGNRTWRVLHLTSFAAFALALLHGIWSGSDSGALWAIALYAGSALSVGVMTVYRIVAARQAAVRPTPAG